MKIINKTETKIIVMFEVQYSDSIKKILIPKVLWTAFEHIYSFAFIAGGAGEFENEFPSQEDKLKAFHKAFNIDSKSQQVGNIQIWQPDMSSFSWEILFSKDDSNPVIQETINEWNNIQRVNYKDYKK